MGQLGALLDREAFSLTDLSFMGRFHLFWGEANGRSDQGEHFVGCGGNGLSINVGKAPLID
jgi:hypothetical protein